MKKQINEIKRMQQLAGIIKEEDGSSMSDPDMVAKVVAQKYGAELKPLFNEYQESYEQYIKDIRNKKPNQQELAKAHNAIVKAFQNQAISMAGNEMLQAGMNNTKVNNLLSGYGYFEDWLSDYVSAINKELNTSKNYDFPIEEEDFTPIAKPEEKAIRTGK